MQFSELVTKIVKINNVVNMKSVFRSFDVKTFEELESMYLNDRAKFIEKFAGGVMTSESFLNPFLNRDRDFLNGYSPQIIDYINFSILKANGTQENYDEEDESEDDESEDDESEHVDYSDYFDWKYAKFTYADFTINDLYTISVFLETPPLPLTRYFFGDEHRRNKNLVIQKIYNDDLYRGNLALKHLINLVFEDKEKGDFKVTIKTYKDETLVLFLHSWVLSQHKFFESILKLQSDDLSLILTTESLEAGEIFIRYIYGEFPSFDKLSEDTIIEIFRLADFTQIGSLVNICYTILNGRDYEKEYRIKQNRKNMNNWFNGEYINRFFEEDQIREFKIRMTKCVKKQNYNGILEIVREMKLVIGSGYEQIFDYIFNNQHDERTKTDEFILNIIIGKH